MLFAVFLYVLLGIACLAALGLLLLPWCLASGWWASASGRRDAAAAEAIERLFESDVARRKAASSNATHQRFPTL